MSINSRSLSERGRLLHRSASGFLLIEVVLAMAILVVVTVGMYKIMAASITTASELRNSKRRTQEVNGLIELCRRTISRLPNTATITSRVTSDSGKYFPELLFTDAPQILSFGPSSAHYGPKALAAREQLGGLWTMSIVFEPDESENRLTVNEIELPPPVALIGDIRSIEWLFYDIRSTSWMEKWEQPQTRPQLIRLILTVAENDDPYIATFWVPPAGSGPQTATSNNSSGDNTDSPTAPLGAPGTPGTQPGTPTPTIVPAT